MTNPNDLAFSSVPTDASGSNAEWEPGLTKREYFAAMAMQGLLSNPERLRMWNTEWKAENYMQGIRQETLQMADALIDELNKGTK